MYALMLLDTADVIREFPTLDDAKAAYEAFLEDEPALRDTAGILQIEDGVPVGDPISLAGLRFN